MIASSFLRHRENLMRSQVYQSIFLFLNEYQRHIRKF